MKKFRIKYDKSVMYTVQRRFWFFFWEDIYRTSELLHARQHMEYLQSIDSIKTKYYYE